MPCVSGLQRCFNHAPECAAARVASRRRGGKAARATPAAAERGSIDLGTPAGILAELTRVYRDSVDQAYGTARSRALNTLINTAIALLGVGGFEERLAALEAMMAAGPRRTA